jgi:hypothetical protein
MHFSPNDFFHFGLMKKRKKCFFLAPVSFLDTKIWLNERQVPCKKSPTEHSARATETEIKKGLFGKFSQSNMYKIYSVELFICVIFVPNLVQSFTLYVFETCWHIRPHNMQRAFFQQLRSLFM